MDFYDPDIEKKIIALEKEEEKLLKAEAGEDALWEKMNADSENSDDVDFDQLKGSLKQVRGKKAILKERHKMKGTNHLKPKNIRLSEIVDGMQAKGHDVNVENIRSRSKSRKTLMDLEGAQDKLAKDALDMSSDEDVSDDPEMA
jgi:hypothetical protein